MSAASGTEGSDAQTKPDTLTKRGQTDQAQTGPVDAIPAAPASAWFDDIARFLGPSYLRYSFTKGTVQEVTFLVDALGLHEGSSVFDAGCGPGRHSLELARRGVRVVGADHSADFVALASDAARAETLLANFVVADVLALPVRPVFDAVICLCQGGFGLLGGHRDLDAFAAIASAVPPGGRLALSAFSAAFAIRHLEEEEHFDVSTGVFHEFMDTRNEDGDRRRFEGWTTCFTPRELGLLATSSGLVVDGLHGVTPGEYGTDEPGLTHPEILLLAHKSA